MDMTGWLTADQASDLLGITRKSLYDYVLRVDGFPQPTRVGRTLLFRTEPLKEWREQHPARQRRRLTD